MIHIRRNALVRYSPAQMFELVNDVEAYPSRFSWCASAEVLNRMEESLTARLELRLAGIIQGFTTHNTLVSPARIVMRLVDGPFRSLAGEWTFIALGEAGCKVSLALDFEYSGLLVGAALRLGFQGLANRMVDDFCREAQRVYG